jgi:predicted ester cyclase
VLANNTASQENIALMRNAFAALGRRDFAAAEFLSPDFIINLAGVPHQMHGRRTWRRNAEAFFNAFPDIQLETQDMFATDDNVAVRFALAERTPASSWEINRPESASLPKLRTVSHC